MMLRCFVAADHNQLQTDSYKLLVAMVCEMHGSTFLFVMEIANHGLGYCVK